ncbi:L-aspartate oxidase [Candidatus Termititenax persephonae]|uniref:L-aspartate oxidase n=1 Tax=Candidatus Termititenax persephonae TaxID=2218525 RepID=A0A388TH50_9BACT|nr:L-aspartate oxidase [Candidatus Termititenax persephonae]
MLDEVYFTDVLIVGAGVAGLSAAIEAAKGGKVFLAHKGDPNISSTQLAQGGVAVVMDKTDSPVFHYRDTLYAGAGLCTQKAVKVLVAEGIPRVRELLEMGVVFDRDDSGLILGQEAAHSHRRILHAGDTTGAEVERGMLAYLQKNNGDNLTLSPATQCLELLLERGRCVGGIFLRDGRQFAVLARNTVLATGGYVQVFKYNTNFADLCGDGIALAYRAGARIRDMEFVQFHPTSLYETRPQGSQFLISEAVRGEGAVLRNVRRRRFMPDYHAHAELAPRDVVSRAIVAEMRKTNADHVLLDFTTAAIDIPARFPSIYRQCQDLRINVAKDLVPVVPAAHYSMGGIATDIFGRTSVPGLLACGECASTGVHGANRLASNSLLEGLVFGRRAAVAALRDKGRGGAAAGKHAVPLRKPVGNRAAIQEIMWRQAGIIRDGAGLKTAWQKLQNLPTSSPDEDNLLLCAKLCVSGAWRRRESRGSHYRVDYPRRGWLARHSDSHLPNRKI